MAKTIYHVAATGGTFYAFPRTQSLTDWTTYRVLFVEGTGDNVGLYSASIDQGLSDLWDVFSGATQPTSWNDKVATIEIVQASAVQQEPVPANRTAVLEPTAGSGLYSSTDIELGGSSVLIAADFRKDLGPGVYVQSITSIAINEGNASGITFAESGVYGSQAKWQATGVTTGNYVARATVLYSDGSTRYGDFEMKVL